MSATDPLQHMLDRVVAHVGDPAPRVYERLFAAWPELQPLFVGDADGKVRAEMFLRALEALLGLAEGQPWAGGLIAAERDNHAMAGVAPAHFDAFFQVMGQVFRDAIGDEWNAATQAAWSAALARLGSTA